MQTPTKRVVDTYLFDWGDTLMVDFPGVPGKMCDWKNVAPVEGAAAALRYLSRGAKLYVATGATDSTAAEVKAAFQRVGLDTYISGYFCKANLGVDKGTADFLPAILRRLASQPQRVTVVGDNWHKDIQPALALGIHAVWLCQQPPDHPPEGVRIITSLDELCA